MLPNTNSQLLVQALRRDNPAMHPLWAERMAPFLIRELDPVFELNVSEYIEGKPLTDVWVFASDGRMFSIASVMEATGDTFASAARTVNLLLTDEALAMARIFRTVL